MQYGECLVSMGDSGLHVAKKYNVTPAEVVMLRQIHGPEAVTDVQPRGSDRRPLAEEVDRLRKCYGARAFLATFPGASPILPSSFSDVGIDSTVGAEIREERAARKPRNPKAQVDATAPAVMEISADAFATADEQE
jgi:hypothetical protein